MNANDGQYVIIQAYSAIVSLEKTLVMFETLWRNEVKKIGRREICPNEIASNMKERLLSKLAKRDIARFQHHICPLC